MNIMVTGLFRAYRPDEADRAPLFSSVQPSAATSLEQEVTLENACLFLFARNLLYLLVFVTSACGLLAACAVARNAVSPKT
jgi:hypothetical protein